MKAIKLILESKKYSDEYKVKMIKKYVVESDWLTHMRNAGDKISNAMDITLNEKSSEQLLEYLLEQHALDTIKTINKSLFSLYILLLTGIGIKMFIYYYKKLKTSCDKLEGKEKKECKNKASTAAFKIVRTKPGTLKKKR